MPASSTPQNVAREMSLYAHWLDGEHVRLAARARSHYQDVRQQILYAKVHALLGTQFVLSDVQLIDSAAVLALFGDSKFRAFVKSDPSFLDLRVEPRADPTASDSQLQQAARGMERAMTDGWTSSVFVDDPEPIVRVARETIAMIAKPDTNNPFNPTVDSAAVNAANLEHRPLLRAARHAIDYFAKYDRPTLLSEVKKEDRTNYYKVLKEWRNVASGDELRRVETALQFVDAPERTVANEWDKERRAWAKMELERDATRSPFQRERIWRTIVQAWNYAIQRTLQPDGGSAGTLLGTGSPATVFGESVDVIVPAYGPLAVHMMRAVKPAPTLEFDLDAMLWTDIHEARIRTSNTLGALSAARRGDDPKALKDAARRHVAALSRVLPAQLRLPGEVQFTLMALNGAIEAPQVEPVLTQLREMTHIDVRTALHVMSFAVRATPAVLNRARRLAVTSTLEQFMPVMKR